MKQCVLAALLIGAVAVPASAATSFYVVKDRATKRCSIATTPPTDTKQFRTWGPYTSEKKANEEMAANKKCK
jgi:hypothetical protein